MSRYHGKRQSVGADWATESRLLFVSRVRSARYRDYGHFRVCKDSCQTSVFFEEWRYRGKARLMSGQEPSQAPLGRRRRYSDDGLSPANIWQESLSDSADAPVTLHTERGQCGREPDSTDVPVPRQTTERGQCGQHPDSADVPVTRQTVRGPCGS